MKVYLAHSQDNAAEAGRIADYLRGNGFDLATPLNANAEIARDGLAALLAADACIALVGMRTGRELFDVGVAAGAGVPTLVVALPGAEVPQPLSSHLYVAFRGNASWDYHNLSLRLLELERVPRPDRPLMAFDADALRGVERDLAAAATLDDRDFAALIEMLLERRGFTVQETEVGERERADLVCQARGFGLVVFEIKRRGRAGLVSVEAARQVLGYGRALRADRTVVVSDAGFTSSAQAFARDTGVRLLGLDELIAASTPGEILDDVDDDRAEGGKVGQPARDDESYPSLAWRSDCFEGDAASVARLALRIYTELSATFSGAGLGHSDFPVLLAAYITTKVRGAISLVELATTTGLSVTTALRVAARLTDAGWFIRKEDPENARRNLIVMPPGRVDWLDEMLSTVGGGGVRQIADGGADNAL